MAASPTINAATTPTSATSISPTPGPNLAQPVLLLFQMPRIFLHRRTPFPSIPRRQQATPRILTLCKEARRSQKWALILEMISRNARQFQQQPFTTKTFFNKAC
uniref:Uncharacterized protein n=1 Tax=Romanomermis culicivorax TaxID=13658 RepID=A0A915JJT7_ROMCU